MGRLMRHILAATGGEAMIPSVFFALSKVLDLLLAPVTWSLLLLLAGLLWRKRPAGAGAGLLVFSVEPVADALTGVAEAGVGSAMRPGVVYDAGIVLGGG